MHVQYMYVLWLQYLRYVVAKKQSSADDFLLPASAVAPNEEQEHYNEFFEVSSHLLHMSSVHVCGLRCVSCSMWYAHGTSVYRYPY